MKIRAACAALLLMSLCPAFGMSKKKAALTIGFHPEANPRDGSSFCAPVNLRYLQRKASITVAPAFSEKQVAAIFPFLADDGSWGCTFQLDDQGRIRLETMSNEQRGTALVVFVGTAVGQHQVVDMLIDREVSSGRITVPRGLTELEIAAMRKQFKVIGGNPLSGKKEERRDDAAAYNHRTGDVAPPMPPPRAVEVPKKRRTPAPPPSPSRSKLQELDLPRVAD